MTTKLSTVIENGDAVPRVRTPTGQHGGKVRVLCGSFELAVADLGAADIILLDSLPTNAIIHKLEIATDDLDSGATNTMDIGIYANDRVTVKDVDAFASAVTNFRTAMTAFVDFLMEAGVVPLANVGKKLFEWAGDSSDPHDEYYIGLTVGGAGDQAGTIAYRITYSLD